jgi:hypothetical protein
MSDIPQLYYNEAVNYVYDEGGYTIFNIFSIISPNIMDLFKMKKEDMVVTT